jgi:hypothetical protein
LRPSMRTTKQEILCSGQARMRTAFVAVAVVANLLLVAVPALLVLTGALILRLSMRRPS